jgi:hypothetical protein
MNDDALKEKLQKARIRLFDDMPHGELQKLQLQADILLRLAMADGGHDHDTVGGVGHHDHKALADLAYLLESPARTREGINIQKA